MTSNEIIQKLKSLSDPKNIEGMKRFAVGGAKTLGISIPNLRNIAKDIKNEYKKDFKSTEIRHQLALELWDTGYHEARILASMIDEPSLVTEKQMDNWIADFDSWDVCDQVCMNLFWQTTFVYQKAIKWAILPHLRHLRSRSVNAGTENKGNKGREFQKRAGFAMMAILAWHDKTATDNQLKQFFPIIIREATDERNFVKKAVNWALRQIGKSRPSLRQPTIDCAKEIIKKYPNSKSARWIANDAIRELSNLEK